MVSCESLVQGHEDVCLGLPEDLEKLGAVHVFQWRPVVVGHGHLVPRPGATESVQLR